MELPKFRTVVLLCLTAYCAASKYDEQANIEQEKPFKIMKINLIWQKARLRLKEKSVLSSLHQDLKHQDQLEVDLKHRRALGDDEDGEFEALVRRKFLDVIVKYGLEGIHPDTLVPKKTNEAGINRHTPQQNAQWEKVVLDKKLGKLWNKAQLSGFTDKELGALKAELLHHMDKVEEIEILKSELYDKDGLRNNKVDVLKDAANDATLRQEREQHIHLKRRYKELRDNVEQIEERITNDKPLDDTAAGGFRHPKVIDLWFDAKKSNFTAKELISIRDELQHFEHKLRKLATLEEEHDVLAGIAQRKDAQLGQHPEKHLKVQQKVNDYGRKVKKYEHEIKSRIDRGTAHNEL